jgi:hypothetical protein
MNILSWQFDDKYEGGKKAKARAIVLAYQYPLYAEGPTAAPTSSRARRHFSSTVLQLAKSSKWKKVMSVELSYKGMISNKNSGVDP